jgi:hypothetical protein
MKGPSPERLQAFLVKLCYETSTTVTVFIPHDTTSYCCVLRQSQDECMHVRAHKCTHSADLSARRCSRSGADPSGLTERYDLVSHKTDHCSGQHQPEIFSPVWPPAHVRAIAGAPRHNSFAPIKVTTPGAGSLHMTLRDSWLSSPVATQLQAGVFMLLSGQTEQRGISPGHLAAARDVTTWSLPVARKVSIPTPLLPATGAPPAPQTSCHKWC